MATENPTETDPGSLSRLRTAAEAQLAELQAGEVSARADTELVHELQVGRIELEMQNETLIEARDELEQSRDRFFDFYELAPVGYLTITDTGLIADINRTGAALLGTERNRILQRRFSSFVIPDDEDRYHSHFFGALKADRSLTVELTLLRVDGSQVHVRLDSLRLIKDGQARVLQGVLTDMTERRQPDDVLVASESKYRALVETTGTGYLIVDTEGRVLDANPAYVRLTGHDDVEDILGRSVIEWTAGNQKEMNAVAVAQCARDGFIRDFVVDYVDGNGQLTPVEINATVIGDRDSSRMIALCRDITERKQAENKLGRERELYADLINAQPGGIYRVRIFNPDTWAKDAWMSSRSAPYSMDLVTDRFCSILGITKKTFENNPGILNDLVHPDDKEGFAKVHDEAMANPKRFRWEGRILNDGRTRWVSFESLPRPLENGDVLWTGSLTDITERKQAEAEVTAAKTAAEIANVTKSRFLAAASHDLRQPMQAIGLFSEALARTSLSGEQKRISDCLSQSIQSMDDVLSALLDISRLDAGAVKANLEVVHAEALAHTINAEYSRMAAGKSLRFKLCVPCHDMAILTDGKLLMSLLGNLIANAIKYAEQGGILVAIRRRRDQALIQVWDTGIGIRAEHLDAIYEEYFQVGNPERDKTKGLGLGLAIAKRIANLLETVIVCRSRPGRGSVFEFRLPLASGEETETQSRIEPPASGHEASPAARRIVLVEDDLMVATAMKLTLELCGMTVTRYKTAEDALADSSISDADFYISDLRLPGLSGVEFLDAVQRTASKPIQALVVTGDTAINRIELMRSAAWPVLFKPVELSSLLAAIESQGSAH